MTGILAINAFLHSEKYTQQDKLLLAGAKACGINLKIYSNLELRLAVPKADFVLFWDKDVSLAHALEQQGLPVFNSAKAIALCDNKALTYQTLLCTVPQPETMVAPITYFEDSNFSPFIDGAIEHLGLPLVFKECYGSFGAQVFLCHSKEEIERHITARPFLLQKFCKESAGHDMRIEVIGGRCVAAMERYNPADFRANALSFVGLWALARKYIEQWFFWIIVDAVCFYSDFLRLFVQMVTMLHSGMICL